MVTTIGIRENITNLNDLQSKFNLRQTEDDQFFPEWEQDLPEISPREKTALERIKQRYNYHRAAGPLLEGTVNLIVVSPLLELAGLLDPPFRIRSPQSVEIIIEDGEKIIKGLIDILVVQEQFWVLVVESKRTSISVPSAFPQILAYMMANPHPNKPTFGVATNGDGFVFIKLSQKDTPQYDLSREFSLFPKRHELYNVLRILKKMGQLVSYSNEQ